MIKAVTFDLWDTLVIDDSDEPKRLAAGMRSKYDERRHLLWQALQAHAPTERDIVWRAYDVADAAFNAVWHDQFVTWPIEYRLQVILDGLKRTLPDSDLDDLLRAHQIMEVETPPSSVPGVKAALEELSQRYKLCIVSDAIVTPGQNLRDLLANYDLKRFFDGFAFSDEVGHSKPHRAMFTAAADQLQVDVSEMVHVGDREHNDVDGAKRLGMKAVLFTAACDRGSQNTQADAVCDGFKSLPATIAEISNACVNM